MKKVYFFISSLFISSALIAQEVKNVGIGTSSPDKSAVLDLNATDKGLLIPRLSSSQISAISNPATGLMVFQTDESKSGFFYFNGLKWTPLTNEGANSIATLDANGWALDGNAITTGNKAAATVNSFIGTPGGVPINFKIGANKAGQITNDNVFVGLFAGNVTTGVGNVGIGRNTLFSNLSGARNVAIGGNALYSNIDGSANFALGLGALQSNTSGTTNVALGNEALLNNTTANYNVAIGNNALRAVTINSNNVAIGINSQYNSLGNNNTSLGAFTLYHNQIGSGNLSLGTRAGFNKDGSNNVYIGYLAGGATSLKSESNKLYLANSNTETPLIYGDFSARFVSIGNVPVDRRESVAASGNYSLIVERGILSEKLKVALKTSNDWADYVFEPEYKANMMSLEEVEEFTLKNKHLPNVPSAKELVEKGLDFNDTSKMFMEKIEELTLYLIELNKEVKALKLENEQLRKK